MPCDWPYINDILNLAWIRTRTPHYSKYCLLVIEDASIAAFCLTGEEFFRRTHSQLPILITTWLSAALVALLET